MEAIRDAGGTPFVFDRDVSNVSGAKALEVDVSNREAVEAAVREAAETLGGLDGVVTAAGIDRCGKLGDVPAEEWEKVIGVNLLGTVSVVRAALPYLKGPAAGSSPSPPHWVSRALPDATAYCASKFGVIGFSRALAAETGGEIGVTTIIPGGMKTHFFDDRDEQYKPQDDSKPQRSRQRGAGRGVRPLPAVRQRGPRTPYLPRRRRLVALNRPQATSAHDGRNPMPTTAIDTPAGRDTAESGGITITDPRTGEVLWDSPRAGPEAVNHAVEVAAGLPRNGLPPRPRTAGGPQGCGPGTGLRRAGAGRAQRQRNRAAGGGSAGRHRSGRFHP